MRTRKVIKNLKKNSLLFEMLFFFAEAESFTPKGVPRTA